MQDFLKLAIFRNTVLYSNLIYNKFFYTFIFRLHILLFILN